MFKVIETFSGIGAQAKALERNGIEYKIVNTCDWDISAIIAYCRIHCGGISTDVYSDVSDEAIDDFLRSQTLSMDGKQPLNERLYNKLSDRFKRLLFSAIKQSNNLVSITDVTGADICEKQDRNPNSGLVTYNNGKLGKTKWRYLTPRECFMLMGFDEMDYEKAFSDNPEYTFGKTLFTNEKKIKMAGNSICVDVLEAIFKQIKEIDKIVFV